MDAIHGVLPARVPQVESREDSTLNHGNDGSLLQPRRFAHCAVLK